MRRKTRKDSHQGNICNLARAIKRMTRARRLPCITASMPRSARASAWTRLAPKSCRQLWRRSSGASTIRTPEFQSHA